MQISVVLPICKEEPKLKTAIESVLAQDFSEEFELLVVDDLQAASHTHILPDYEDDQRVKILCTKGGEGLSAALNLALSHAKGKYISRMDAEVVFLSSLLRQSFERHEQAGDDISFTGSKRFWLTCSGKPYCKISEEADAYLFEFREHLIERRQQFTDAGCLFLKSRALAVGGYRMYANKTPDIDLWLRLMEHTGKPCLTIQQLLVGKHLLPGSVIFEPGMHVETELPRALARFRIEQGLPANHLPQPEWLTNVKAEMTDLPPHRPRVYLPVDVAMINLWLRDYRGFFAFLRMAFFRNPMRTTRILIRHWIFGWYHDFIEGERVVLIP